DEIARVHLGVANRTAEIDRRDPLLHRLHLELPLAHVLEVLGGAEEHVDERAEERRDQPANRRGCDPQQNLDPPPGALVRREAQAQPEHEGEEGEAVEDRVLSAGAEEAGERHRRILPIIQPAAKAEPIAAARAAATRTNIESFSLAL